MRPRSVTFGWRDKKVKLLIRISTTKNKATNTQLRCAYLEAAGPLVIFDETVLVQDVGCCVHQVHPAPLQQGVCTPVVVRNTIQGGVAKHAHIEICVAKPVHSILITNLRNWNLKQWGKLDPSVLNSYMYISGHSPLHSAHFPVLSLHWACQPACPPSDSQWAAAGSAGTDNTAALRETWSGFPLLWCHTEDGQLDQASGIKHIFDK